MTILEALAITVHEVLLAAGGPLERKLQLNGNAFGAFTPLRFDEVASAAVRPQDLVVVKEPVPTTDVDAIMAIFWCKFYIV